MYLIAIGDGHGAETAGKRTPPFANGSVMKENEFNKATVNYLEKELERCGFSVLQTAPEETDTPLSVRAKRANDAGADLYISIHANAFGSGWNDANGVESWIYSKNDKDTLDAAQKIQSEVIKETGLKDRGIKESGNSLGILRDTKMSAVLVECGFMTNQQEAALLKSDAYRKKVAKAICRGVCMHFGVKYQEEGYHMEKIKVILPGKEVEMMGVKVIDENGNVIGSLSKNGFRIEQAEKISLGEYFNYDSSGKIDGNKDVFLSMGGWQIKKTTVYDEPAEYWETAGSQLNGIGAYGPWAFWGGWNGEGAFNKNNYKFLVTEDGICKAMSWVTGSKAEWKQDIHSYEDGALQKILETTVYRYQLKEHPKNESGRHIGFVIGEGYNLADDILDESKSSVDMYSALGVAYKAIQELSEKVTVLEKRLQKYKGEEQNATI